MRTRMKWPRCGFRFAASREDIIAQRWRICNKPWIHVLYPRFRHEGPLIDDERLYG